jgi:hypothetical protein
VRRHFHLLCELIHRKGGKLDCDLLHILGHIDRLDIRLRGTRRPRKSAPTHAAAWQGRHGTFAMSKDAAQRQLINTTLFTTARVFHGRCGIINRKERAQLRVRTISWTHAARAVVWGPCNIDRKARERRGPSAKRTIF